MHPNDRNAIKGELSAVREEVGHTHRLATRAFGIALFALALAAITLFLSLS